MLETQGRHLGHAEFATCQKPAMPSDHVVVAIDEDRHIEAKGLDAVGDLPDLLLAVLPGIGWIRLQLADRSINDLEMTPGGRVMVKFFVHFHIPSSLCGMFPKPVDECQRSRKRSGNILFQV